MKKKTTPASIGSLAAVEAALQSIIHLLAAVVDGLQTAPEPAEPDYSELNYKNVREAAKALGTSVDSLYIMAKREDFPGYKLGTRWVIPKKELAEWNSKMARERAEI